MILPIVAYGDPLLKKEAEEIDPDFPRLKQLIDNMYETMYNASGVGIAAPQVGQGIRLFVIDTAPFAEDAEEDGKTDPAEVEKLKNFKRVFINPIMVSEEGEEWPFSEGCLSIPGIREEVSRKSKITLEYYDEHFELREEVFDGLIARVIQHEYDHIEGVLFTDRLSPLRKQLIRKKLAEITQGKTKVDYKMKFPKR